MERPRLPLNALRAFEAAARHGSFTRAAEELCITQAAVSRHVKGLEDRLGTVLFRRLPRGLALTDEGGALAPTLTHTFDNIAHALNGYMGGHHAEPLTLGVVASFATGCLLPRIDDFHRHHPGIDLRIMTNNNRVEQAGEGIDMAIRFGDGDWPGVVAIPLCAAPLTPLCSPATARRLTTPADLAAETLLRSYRTDEWQRWFNAVGAACPMLRGPMFDSSPAMAMAAANGLGVALLPYQLFQHELAAQRLVRPFEVAIDAGKYWLTHLRSKEETAAMRGFREWVMNEMA